MRKAAPDIANDKTFLALGTINNIKILEGGKEKILENTIERPIGPLPFADGSLTLVSTAGRSGHPNGISIVS